MIKISVASGKGGTGKTSVSKALAFALSTGRYIKLFDCDVETPNITSDSNFRIKLETDVNVLTPEFNEDLCKQCGICVRQCKFNALALVKGKLLFYEELCRNCGVCSYLCPENAITETEKKIGSIQSGYLDMSIDAHSGILNIREQYSSPVIQKLKQKSDDTRIQIFDCPPGTGTQVFRSVYDTDYCILVTEPTIFGLNDLKLMIQVTQKTGVPFGIVINKSDNNKNIITDFAESNNYDVILEIPFNINILKSDSKKSSILQAYPEYYKKFRDMYNLIIKKI